MAAPASARRAPARVAAAFASCTQPAKWHEPEQVSSLAAQALGLGWRLGLVPSAPVGAQLASVVALSAAVVCPRCGAAGPGSPPVVVSFARRGALVALLVCSNCAAGCSVSACFAEGGNDAR